ncbi:unnamed protein product [Candidula unifasciata]|uniref:Uncharacterized protein n=1 Tax=Candidula unifasciata TaxID=100452 RepID=A0A8S3Z9M9_9EUPU|nr:unnamed protein product [Candidula unifasciata]
MAHNDVNYIPFQDELDNSSCRIRQIGSCFIMDTEAVRSSPLLELRQRDDLRQLEPKKRSLPERMSCVRNNIRVNSFAKATSGLERQKCKTLQTLHESCGKLRHEIKLLDLDRFSHEMDVRKRLAPDKDFTCEDSHIQNTSRRLGTGVTSCYLDKSLSYPLRSRSVRDTPIVRKARASLRIQELHRSFKKHVETKRANTQSVTPSSSQMSAIPGTSSRNQAQHSSKYGLFSSVTGKHASSPAFPPHLATPGFDKRGKITASTNAKLMTLTSVISDDLNDSFNCSEDEPPHLPEHIDLKAHFFGGRQSTSVKLQTLSSSSNTITSQQLLRPKKLKTTPHRLLTDRLQNEVCHINTKVLEFLRSFPTSKYNQGVSKRNDLNNYLKYQIIKDNNATTPKESEKVIAGLDAPIVAAEPHCEVHLPATDRQSDKPFQPNRHNTSGLGETSTRSQYSWKLIKGTSTKDRQTRTQTVNDLVLQALTGMPICNILGSHVPLRAASRAMRHTATFKMHTILENLVNERTRYQKYEIGELRRAMEGQKNVTSGSAVGRPE